MNAPTEVDFHFDVMCPWAYQTSLWMRDVRDQLGLTVNWRFFSLEEVNRGGGQEAPVGAGVVLRLVDDAHRRDAAPRRHGPARPLVRGGRAGAARRRPPPHDPDVARHLLDEIGADPAHRRRGDRRPDHPRRDPGRARPGHRRRRLRCADAVLPRRAVPVRTGADRPADRRRRRSAVATWSPAGSSSRTSTSCSGPRHADDRASSPTTFRPYLEARDWVSINRGKVVSIPSVD